MAEYGEWNRKGATLTEATAQTEYGLSREFILAGIRSGALDYREASMWGNSSLRILRSQLEAYVTEKLGAAYLAERKTRAELSVVNKEIGSLRRKLASLQERKAELEAALGGSGK